MSLKYEYDVVYLTNTPSFYKLNLCQRLGEAGCRVLLVFYGYGSEAVNTVLSDRQKRGFDYRFISDGDSHRRSKWRTLVALCRLMRSVEARKVVYAGWLAPEYNLYSFFSPKSKNVMVVESTIMEASVAGVKGWLKRRIVGRMSAALPSGKPHRQLLDALGFSGAARETGSVGIFYKPGRPERKTRPSGGMRYLYVGRLIDCKNLRFLIEQFNVSGRQLTIVGKGELEGELKAAAGSNIQFAGFVDNNCLGDVYREHDVFILPSRSEPWGLVVEEAIYWGLPVVVSDRVGSAFDLVESLGTGEVFELDNVAGFNESLRRIESDYDRYASAVAAVDFDRRDEAQVAAYLGILGV